MPVFAQNESSVDLDSVDISLLTCSPHEEIYSLYGHSALRYHDLRTGEDVVFNWGLFNFKAPHFVLRFGFGLTDYELGTTPMAYFCNYYRKWGSSVTEQKLNLTSEEKKAVMQALNENLQPDNRVYRYNFFYDNCSTRPRNIIEKCLEGTVSYKPRPDCDDLTFRQMIHQCTEGHPWASFGNDLLLGLKADQKTTQRERQFLPSYLSWDFDHATVTRHDGSRPLVLRKVTHVPLGTQLPQSEFPLSPLACTLLLLGVSAAIAIYEWKKKTTLAWWDALLMLVSGLAGCILLLMFFSEHPTTSTNLQILVLNPLALVFIPSVIRRRKTYWFHLNEVLLCAFLVGYNFQRYDTSMLIVALCLLLRCMIHRYNEK